MTVMFVVARFALCCCASNLLYRNSAEPRLTAALHNGESGDRNASAYPVRWLAD